MQARGRKGICRVRPCLGPTTPKGFSGPWHPKDFAGAQMPPLETNPGPNAAPGPARKVLGQATGWSPDPAGDSEVPGRWQRPAWVRLPGRLQVRRLWGVDPDISTDCRVLTKRLESSCAWLRSRSGRTRAGVWRGQGPGQSVTGLHCPGPCGKSSGPRQQRGTEKHQQVLGNKVVRAVA